MALSQPLFFGGRLKTGEGALWARIAEDGAGVKRYIWLFLQWWPRCKGRGFS